MVTGIWLVLHIYWSLLYNVISIIFFGVGMYQKPLNEGYIILMVSAYFHYLLAQLRTGPFKSQPL